VLAAGQFLGGLASWPVQCGKLKSHHTSTLTMKPQQRATRRYVASPIYRLQEFVAHNGPVHCCRLGSKSGQLLATGAEDRRVNVWRIGDFQPLVGLAGILELCIWEVCV